MKILFDQGTPAPLRRSLAEHEVDTVFEKGWNQLKNGELLAVAILNGYEILVSTDQSLGHQHDLRRIRLGVVVLMTTSWPRISRNTPAVVRAVEEVQMGHLVEVRFEDF
jgi:predicted nuclease of predicted toxin-antitoxin system